MRFVVVFLILLTAVSCQQNSVVQKDSAPLDFSGYRTLDWRRNKDLETTAVFDIAEQEKKSRTGYYSIMSHLGTSHGEKQYASFRGDMRLTLLDHAVCFMISELHPQYVPIFSASRRTADCVEVLSNIREYKTLENSGLLSFREKEEFEMLLLVTGTSMGTDMRSVAELFDYSTIPQYARAEQNKNLPSWISWTKETPLLWAKLLMQLPQETMRAPGIDREKVALCAMKISRAVAGYAVHEHVKNLQNVNDSSDVRRRCRTEFELALAYAWQNRFPDSDWDFSIEERFLSDIWQLMQ